jgi:hypothetical protein
MARSKVRTSAMAALAATGVAAWFRRRRRSDSAAIVHDLVSPSGVNEPVSVGSTSNDGHAAGHRHLAPPPRIASSSLAHRAERRWAQAKRRSSGRTP